MSPQASYSNDAVYLTTGLYCKSHEGDEQYLSALYAYSKDALYAPCPADKAEHVTLMAATYLAPTAWYRSVDRHARALLDDSFKPLNNHIQPSRPQDAGDALAPPLFVMKVG